MSMRLWLVMGLVGSAMAGNGLILPVLTLYGETFGASGFQLGLLITLFGVARLVLNYPTGMLYRSGRAAALMMTGNGLIAIGALGGALTDELGILLLCRIVQGAGSGIFLTTAGIIVAEASRPGMRGRLMANYQAAVFLGAALGPVIGGALAGAYGIRAPFWVYALVSAAAVAFCSTVRFDTGTPVATPAPLPLREMVRLKALWPNLFMGFTNGFARTAALWQSIPLLAVARFDMTMAEVGLAVTITALANLLVLPVSGALVDRIGSRQLPWIATLLFALSLALIAASPSEVAFWTGVVGAGLAGGLCGPALASALVETAGSNGIGPYMGAQRTFQDLGFICGPIIVGLAVDASGGAAEVGLYLTGGLLAASSAFWLANRTQTQPA